jgi:hypothetical protein
MASQTRVPPPGVECERGRTFRRVVCLPAPGDPSGLKIPRPLPPREASVFPAHQRVPRLAVWMLCIVRDDATREGCEGAGGAKGAIFGVHDAWNAAGLLPRAFERGGAVSQLPHTRALQKCKADTNAVGRCTVSAAKVLSSRLWCGFDDDFWACTVRRG